MEGVGDGYTLFSRDGSEVGEAGVFMQGRAVLFDSLYATEGDSLWVSFYGFGAPEYQFFPEWTEDVRTNRAEVRFLRSNRNGQAVVVREITSGLESSASVEGTMEVAEVEITTSLLIDDGRNRFVAAPTVLGQNVVAGAEFTELRPGLAEVFGVDEGILVTEVFDGTPAELAGLRGGDVIARVNGVPILSLSPLRVALSESRLVEVTVLRKGDTLTLELGR